MLLEEEKMKYTAEYLTNLLNTHYDVAAMVPFIVSSGIAQEMLDLHLEIAALKEECDQLRQENLDHEATILGLDHE